MFERVSLYDTKENGQSCYGARETQANFVAEIRIWPKEGSLWSS